MGLRHQGAVKPSALTREFSLGLSTLAVLVCQALAPFWSCVMKSAQASHGIRHCSSFFLVSYTTVVRAHVLNGAIVVLVARTQIAQDVSFRRDCSCNLSTPRVTLDTGFGKHGRFDRMCSSSSGGMLHSCVSLQGFAHGS